MADHYDEMMFLDYVEGDLSREDAERFERLMDADPRLRGLVAQIMADREALRSLPVQQAPAELMDRVTAGLERQMLLGEPATEPVAAVGPGRTVTRRSDRRFSWLITFTGLAAAAAVAFGAFVTWDAMFGPHPTPPVGPLAMNSDNAGSPADAIALKPGERDGVMKKAAPGIPSEQPTSAAAGGGGNAQFTQSDDTANRSLGQQLAQAGQPTRGKAGEFAEGESRAGQAGQALKAGRETLALKGAPPTADAAAVQVTDAQQIDGLQELEQLQLVLLDTQVDRLEVGVKNQYARLTPQRRQLQVADVQSRQRSQALQSELAQTEKASQDGAGDEALKLKQQAQQAPAAQPTADAERLAATQARAIEPTTVATVAGPRIEVVTGDVLACQNDLTTWSAQNKVVCVPYPAAGGTAYGWNNGNDAAAVQVALGDAQPPTAPGLTPAPTAPAAPATSPASNANPSAAETQRKLKEADKNADAAGAVAFADRAADLRRVAGVQMAESERSNNLQVQVVVIPSSQVPQLLAHLNRRAGQRAQFVDADAGLYSGAFAGSFAQEEAKAPGDAKDAPVASQDAAKPRGALAAADAPAKALATAPADNKTDAAPPTPTQTGAAKPAAAKAEPAQEVAANDGLIGSQDGYDAGFVFGHRAATTPIVALTDTNWSVILSQQLPLATSAPLPEADGPITVPVVIQFVAATAPPDAAANEAPAEPLPSKAKAR